MLEYVTTLGPFSIRTYTLLLSLAVIASLSIGIVRTKERQQWGAIIDAALGAFIGALIFSRIGHVLLHWSYFADNLNEAPQIVAGGSDWHGAVLGGLLGFYLVVRIRKLEASVLLDHAALALPLLSIASWWGCWAATCAFGQEVETLAYYPAWMVSEGRDIYGIPAPRYNTQLFGIVTSLLIFAVAVFLSNRDWLRHRRFWLVLLLISLSAFAIGFVRGDYAVMVGGLRADQWLDLLTAGMSIIMLVVSGRDKKRTIVGA
jgi:phosphatidylglycerol---prolipoprotein diacylglyceryl transferase